MTSPFEGLPEAPAALGLVRDEPMSRHTYLRLGGPAAYFGTPETIEDLDRVVAWAHEVGLPVRVAGGGSNVLVTDEGVRAVVVSLRRSCRAVVFPEGEFEVEAGGGVMLPSLARQAAERGLGGLEFAIGIPGSVGGALQTNAGIGDGRCIGDLVQSVQVLRNGLRRSLDRHELTFDYRTTSLRGSGDIVLSARLALRPNSREVIEAEMRRLLEARQATQPTSEPNAGSVFRNPPGDAAGRLVEAAGCKGLRLGGAQVSTLHANFIVQDGTATTKDVTDLMAEVRRRVLDQFGVTLVPEVEWWGRSAEDEKPEAYR